MGFLVGSSDHLGVASLNHGIQDNPTKTREELHEGILYGMCGKGWFPFITPGNRGKNTMLYPP